ncbi:MAG: hypothetical protein JF631_09055, partial [Mycobacterium sp.]|nr:hypothetical protein [Mycobacterium sp.]
LSEIDIIVTDGSPDHPALVAARGAGVEVVCVAGHSEATALSEGESEAEQA